MNVDDAAQAQRRASRSVPPSAPRRALAAIFLVGSLGTAAELVLLEHLEDAWQRAPLVLIGIGCTLLAVLAVRPSHLAVRLFQLTMVVFLASGIVGIALHYQGNVEFGLELQRMPPVSVCSWRR